MAVSDNTLEPTLASAGWRYRRVVAAAAGLGLLLAVLLFVSRGTVYEATAVLLIDQPRPVVEGGAIDLDRYLEDQLQVMQSRIVIERAADRLSEELDSEFSIRRFNQSTNIVAQGESDLITVTFTADDPETARSGANAVVEVYEAVQSEAIDATTEAALAQTDSALSSVNERIEEVGRELEAALSVWTPSDVGSEVAEATAELNELQERLASLGPGADPLVLDPIRLRIDDIRQQFETIALLRALAVDSPGVSGLARTQATLIDQRAELVARRNQLLIDAELQSDGIAILSPAPLGEPGNPVSPVRYAIVGVVLGSLLGLGLAYAIAMRRRSFDHRSQPEAVLLAPLLADIPVFEDEYMETALPVLHAPRSAAAEAYRFAASSVEISTRSTGKRAIAVISALNGSGKTTAAANLALAAARENHRVLVVDADFGDQALSRLLVTEDLDLQPGLTDVLAENVNPMDHVQSVYVGNGTTLSLIGRGLRPTLATEFFGKPDVARILTQLKKDFDLVVIDTPPLLQIAYATSILAMADGAVAVVPHQSLISEAEDLVARTGLAGTEILGYLYNKAPLRREMTVTAGSMKDVVGDMGFITTPESRRKRS